MKRWIRAGLIGVASAAIMGGGIGAPALAARGGSGHTVTMTKHQHGVFRERHFKANPCTGDQLTTPGGLPGVQFTGNAVEHVTYFPAGDEVWATFTETGRVDAVGESGTTYNGHATVWGNFNLNERNQNSTFTLNLRVNGSDGSSFVAHQTTHITYNGGGVITVKFNKFNLTCS